MIVGEIPIFTLKISITSCPELFVNDPQISFVNMINNIVEPATMCDPDQRVVTEWENNEGLQMKYTALFKAYIFGKT